MAVYAIQALRQAEGLGPTSDERALNLLRNAEEQEMADTLIKDAIELGLMGTA